LEKLEELIVDIQEALTGSSYNYMIVTTKGRSGAQIAIANSLEECGGILLSPKTYPLVEVFTPKQILVSKESCDCIGVSGSVFEIHLITRKSCWGVVYKIERFAKGEEVRIVKGYLRRRIAKGDVFEQGIPLLTSKQIKFVNLCSDVNKLGKVLSPDSSAEYRKGMDRYLEAYAVKAGLSWELVKRYRNLYNEELSPSN
jgi:hypothetical protein